MDFVSLCSCVIRKYLLTEKTPSTNVVTRGEKPVNMARYCNCKDSSVMLMRNDCQTQFDIISM